MSRRRLLSFISGFAAILLVGIIIFQAGQACAGSSSAIASRTEEEQRTIEMYKHANEAVVYITTKAYLVDPFDFMDEVRPQEGSGTGFITDASRGIIVTNLHVIQSVLQNGGTVEIMLASGRNARAKLLGYDQENDIAVFELTDAPKGLTALPFGDSSKVEVGQRVLAIGNPFGLYRSLTSGIISSLDRTMKTPSGVALRNLIQTDAAINPGNSGGPLLDADGRVIGINTAILSQSGDSAGIGFAVPINDIKRILPELIATGKVLRPRMGWQLVDTDQGPMVLRLQPNGPAAKANVQAIERPVVGVFVQGFHRDIDRADLIYRVNGKRVATRDEVEDLIRQSKPEVPVQFDLRRGGVYGEERKVEIRPELQ